MSEFIVHSIPGSPFGRTVMAALEEKGVSWQLSPVVPATMRSPEHLSRHAFGRVPVLKLDDFSLYETPRRDPALCSIEFCRRLRFERRPTAGMRRAWTS